MSPIYVNTDTDERFELDRPNPRLDEHPSYERLGTRGDETDGIPRGGVLTDPRLAVIPQPSAPSRVDRPGLDDDHDPAPPQVDADRDTAEAFGDPAEATDGDSADETTKQAAAKAEKAPPAAPVAQPGQTQRGGRRTRQG